MVCSENHFAIRSSYQTYANSWCVAIWRLPESANRFLSLFGFN